MFPKKSRYYGIETAEFQTVNGKKVIYLRRRFLPPLKSNLLLTEHIVKQGERLDNITAYYLGEPTQFWQICDTNKSCLKPEDLLQFGSCIRIYSPQRG